MYTARIFLFALFFSLCVLGSIDGTVVNRTTSKPAGGVTVTLLKPGQNGMQKLGQTVTDSSGRFAFAKDQPGGGPQLLQATYNAVNYNKLLTPNIPTSKVELDIYEASTSPAVARVAERMMLIEPSASQIAVSETAIVQNDSNTTYNNDALGALLFFLPPAANGQSRVNVQGPQGMPLPRAALKTAEPNVFKVDFPIKPGQTEFGVNYTVPAGSPFTLRSRVVGVSGMPAGPLRLIVPQGVTLAGSDLEKVGTEPKTQATIYTVKTETDFKAEITGIGSLHQNENDSTADTSDQPPVSQGLPRIYRHLGWLVTLALGTLAIGLVVLFRASPVRTPYGK